MRFHRAAVALSLSLALTACTTVSPKACFSGQQAAVQELVYFGAETPDGRVTPDEWRRFLDETVTPRFPQGFTAWQADGQWRSASGSIVREPSHVLSVVHPDTEAHAAAIREIVDTYKTRYAQEAVLQVRTNACMSL